MALTCFDFEACFFLDSLTHLISAYFMCLVGGMWNVANDNDDGKALASGWEQIEGMVHGRAQCCLCATLKATGLLSCL